jgi:NTP pyrophosphatase (non-canonical NTP hydrolase)
VSDLSDLRDRMRRFTDERDWAQFHDPKSLVLALMGEVGEVAELFQWLPAGEARERAGGEPLRRKVEDELADVLLYLVRLADVLGVDLHQAATVKLAQNDARYPAEQVKAVAPERS